MDYSIDKLFAPVLFQFDGPQISVDGKSAISTYNESRLYWTPAPPKLDVAPANVKDVLFPDYQVHLMSHALR